MAANQPKNLYLALTDVPILSPAVDMLVGRRQQGAVLLSKRSIFGVGVPLNIVQFRRARGLLA